MSNYGSNRTPLQEALQKLRILGTSALASNGQRALVLTLRRLVIANLKMRQHRRIDRGRSISLKREENGMEDETRGLTPPPSFSTFAVLCASALELADREGYASVC